MPNLIGYGIVCAVLVLVVVLAIRSIWNGHKSGGQCTGNCARCRQCGASRSEPNSRGR